MRFRWNGAPLGEKTIYQIMSKHISDGNTDGSLRPGMEWAATSDDDAFSTVIQWLYHRIPATRGRPVVAELLTVWLLLLRDQTLGAWGRITWSA